MTFISCLGSISLPLGTHQVKVGRNVIVTLGRGISLSINNKSLLNLSLEHSDRWLFNSKVCHFDIKAMEMDSLDAFTYVVSKLWLTDSLNTDVIWDSARLVELSEEVVEVNDSSRVGHESVPVGGGAHRFVTTFKIVDNLFKVPWEGKHITMLAL